MENPIKMDDMVYILDDIIYNDMVVSIWVNYNDRTLFSRTLESWFIFEESSPNGRKIQVSEIW